MHDLPGEAPVTQERDDATDPRAVQRDLLCPNCAGQCVYDPAPQALRCESCGQTRKLETDTDHEARAETPYDPETPQTEAKQVDGVRVHACETCGGELVFTGPALSDRCPYCDGPVVLGPEDAAYDTMAVVPFRVPEADAQANALDWVTRRWAAPGDLAGTVAKGRVAGLYAPFWTFDSHEALNYWAKYVTGSGDNRRTHRTSGSMKIRFDDLLVPASPHVTPLIRDGILHAFLPDRLRPYRAGFLAGFAAERHHQTVAEGLRANRSDKDLLIRNRIKQHIAKSRVTEIRYKTDTTGIHYRRILLPVWILHYHYGSKAMKVVVSGIDGRTYGERPYSAWKLAGLAGLATGVAMAVGVLWGAAGFL